MRASAWLVGELLVDTGFSHVTPALMSALGDRRVTAICCTHHHEDHVGGCGALQERFGCPAYLHQAGLERTEGLSDLAPYRRLWWGRPLPHDFAAYPPEVAAGGRALRLIPTPGHSATHVVLYEEATGVVFTGDLLISPGASAVMRTENPWALARSLRRVAALRPRRMMTGHGRVMDAPSAALLAKAAHIERTAEAVLDRRARGLSERRIRDELFPHGRGQDLFLTALTGGEFCRLNFVRAVSMHVVDKG